MIDLEQVIVSKGKFAEETFFVLSFSVVCFIVLLLCPVYFRCDNKDHELSCELQSHIVRAIAFLTINFCLAVNKQQNALINDRIQTHSWPERVWLSLWKPPEKQNEGQGFLCLIWVLF